ncbi:NUDIX domain-containing protein [bacterium]|nr:NUDIX domain-containing protein [bacterium]
MLPEIVDGPSIKPKVIEAASKRGRFCHLEFHTSDFSKIKQPRNVNGFAIDSDGKLLLVKTRDGMWGPPGGRIEEGETPEQALVRELNEEGAVTISSDNIEGLFYTETFVDEPVGTWKYLGARLRYVCKIQRKDTFLEDPDGDIVEQVYCDIQDLGKYIDWGETTQFLITALTAYARNSDNKE